MHRFPISPRPNWQRTVQDQGFVYATPDAYYDETAAYAFTMGEVMRLEAATNDIFSMCMKVVQHAIDNDLWREFRIPEAFWPWVKRSWDEDHPALYGRFDLGIRGDEIKLYEFNADTPTSLLEASVIQWYWREEAEGGRDQFNSIHDKLLAHFEDLKNHCKGDTFYFASGGSEEDYLTTKYLEDCAVQTGWKTGFLSMSEIGLDKIEDFVTPDGRRIDTIFKLYPWEWMWEEEFAPALLKNQFRTVWIEPPYKALLSNKMLLHYLHKLFPQSRFILPCHLEAPNGSDYAKKPIFSREGANIALYRSGQVVESLGGEYGKEGYVYQQLFTPQSYDGWTPVVGSWVIGGEAAGIGIRESQTAITGNMSKFRSHVIQG